MNLLFLVTGYLKRKRKRNHLYYTDYQLLALREEEKT